MSPHSCPRGVCGSVQSNKNVMGMDLVISTMVPVGPDNICDRGQQLPCPLHRPQDTDGRLYSLQRIFMEPLLCVRPCSPEQSLRNYFLKCYALSPQYGHKQKHVSTYSQTQVSSSLTMPLPPQ